MLLVNKIKKLVQQAKHDIEIAINKQYQIIFTITQTNNSSTNYLTPIRIAGDKFITGAVLDSTSYATYLVKEIEHLVDQFYVDVEKKLAPLFENDYMDTRNFYSSISSFLPNNKCSPIWPNRLTIDACIKRIPSIQNDIRNLNVGVIGLGNIGFGISKELLSMGVHVIGKAKGVGFREHLIENSLNLAKPSGTISSFKLVNSLEKLAISTDVIFLCANSSDIINKDNYKMFESHLFLIDVGKKNISVELSANKNCKWLDVSSSMISYIEGDIFPAEHSQISLKEGKGVLAGELARPGEVIWVKNKKILYPIGEVSSSSKQFKRYSMLELQDKIEDFDV